MDEIEIHGLRVYAFHGVKPEERRKGQPFVLDLTLEADLRAACETDDLSRTANYSEVIRTVTAAMARPVNLIERAAQQVADAVLEKFPPVAAVTVRLRKPRAPIAADFDDVAVRIRRTRAGRLAGPDAGAGRGEGVESKVKPCRGQ